MTTEHWALPNHVFDKLVIDLFELAMNRRKNPMFMTELSLRLRQDIRPVSRATQADRQMIANTMPGEQALTEAEMMMAITPLLNRCSVGKFKSMDECRAARRMAEDIKIVLKRRLNLKLKEQSNGN